MLRVALLDNIIPGEGKSMDIDIQIIKTLSAGHIYNKAKLVVTNIGDAPALNAYLKSRRYIGEWQKVILGEGNLLEWTQSVPCNLPSEADWLKEQKEKFVEEVNKFWDVFTLIGPILDDLSAGLKRAIKTISLEIQDLSRSICEANAYERLCGLDGRLVEVENFLSSLQKKHSKRGTH
jgi:hypothetical protein